jgi:GNAT superfamily N-acetyltransferase
VLVSKSYWHGYGGTLDLLAIVQGDIPELMDFMEAMRAEAPAMKNVPVDRDRTGACLEGLWNSQMLFGVIAPKRGCMIGLVSANWYDDRLIAYEQMLYVTPEARGRSMLAPRLVGTFVSQARNLGAHEVHVGSSTGIQDERTARLYEVMGFKRSGISLRKELHV